VCTEFIWRRIGLVAYYIQLYANPLIGLILSVLHNISHVATHGGEDLKLSDKLTTRERINRLKNKEFYITWQLCVMYITR
jgi:hypothetical protein